MTPSKNKVDAQRVAARRVLPGCEWTLSMSVPRLHPILKLGWPNQGLTDEVREKINDMIRRNLPQLTKVYNEGMKKEAEQEAMKKPAKKETIAAEAKKKAT